MGEDLSEKLKVLLFYTSYRQLEEFELQVEFINNFKYFKPDIFIYNNNTGIQKASIKEKLNNLNSDINVDIVCDDFNEGYVLGLFNGLTTNYNYYKDYDYVVHLHPDVFITDDEELYKILESGKTEFLITKLSIANCKSMQDYYLTDLFIFKPTNNYISLYKNFTSENQSEIILNKIIKTNEISHSFFNRYTNDELSGGKDLINVWHQHNLIDIRNYIKNNIQ